MGAAAGGAADRLLELLGDQPLDRPGLPVAALPGFVRIEIVHQADQLESQFFAGLAVLLFALDQVAERELLTEHQHRIIGRQMRLSQDRQELAEVPLHARPLAGHELAAVEVEHLLALAGAVEAHPADGVDPSARRVRPGRAAHRRHRR